MESQKPPPQQTSSSATEPFSIDDVITHATCGDTSAASFLTAWVRYVHLIDDVVDCDIDTKESVKIGLWANGIFASPFYRQHEDILRSVVNLVTCNYEDSLEMASSGIPWKVKESNTLRFCGNEMIRIVAWICGGYTRMRSISMDLRSLSNRAHHDEHGNPT